VTQPSRPHIVVLGGINIDLVTVTPRFPAAGETVVGSRFLTYGGGKGANQAVAAVRMGARTSLAGRVGDDLFGPQLLEGLMAAGVDTGAVGVEPGASSGIAVINIDSAAQNRIIQIPGANHTCGPTDAERAIRLLPGAAAVLLQLEVAIDVSLQVMRAAAALGVTVIFDPGPPRPLPDELYRLCSIMTPNETEAQALVGFPVTNVASAERAAQVLLARGAGAVVVKLGARGAYYATAQTAGHVPPFAVTPIDSVAAGDAFNGALAVALAEGIPLPQAVRVAAAAGAIAVTKFGAQDAMPLRSEVEALLRG